LRIAVMQYAERLVPMAYFIDGAKQRKQQCVLSMWKLKWMRADVYFIDEFLLQAIGSVADNY